MNEFVKFVVVIMAGLLGLASASLQFHWEPLTLLGLWLLYVGIIVGMGRFDN